MLNFYRDHSRVITRLILNHFGAAFLGTMLSFATSGMPGLFLATGIFSTLFLLYLDYTVVWEEGAKSRIRVDAGREKYNTLTGLWIGLYASVPSLFLCIFDAVVFWLHYGTEREITSKVAGIVRAVSRLWQSMYLGIIQTIEPEASPLNEILLLCTVIPVLLACWGGYTLGLRQHKMFALFTLRTPEEKRAQREAAKEEVAKREEERRIETARAEARKIAAEKRAAQQQNAGEAEPNADTETNTDTDADAGTDTKKTEEDGADPGK